MRGKKPNPADPYNVEASSADDLDGCAAVEATGLIPVLPKSDSAINSYKEILPYSPDCYAEKEKTL